MVKKFGKYDYIDKITGFIYLNIMKFIGYVHSYCNLKVRKYRDNISVIANNLFHFDSFFYMKDMRVGTWRTRDISIGGKNFTDINFANIRNQVAFIDTTKYFQQSLAVLANK